jgi:hypothetical protein
MADQVMPLATYYRQPVGGRYCSVVEGRWAA